MVMMDYVIDTANYKNGKQAAQVANSDTIKYVLELTPLY